MIARTVLFLGILYSAGTAAAQDTVLHNRRSSDVWVAEGSYVSDPTPLTGGREGPGTLFMRGWTRIPAGGSARLTQTHFFAITRNADGKYVSVNPKSGPGPHVPLLLVMKKFPENYKWTYRGDVDVKAAAKAQNGYAVRHYPRNWFRNPSSGSYEIAGGSSSGGGSGNVESFVFELAPRQVRTYHIEFLGGRPARVSITGTTGSDVDLSILSGTTTVKSSTGLTDSETCVWNPPVARIYRVRIENLDYAKSNRITVHHTGTVRPGTETAQLPGKGGSTVFVPPTPGPNPGSPVNISRSAVLGGGKSASFNVFLRPGRPARIEMSGRGTSDLDVFVFSPDNIRVFADEGLTDRANGSFRPPAPGNYRVEVRNLGNQFNTANVRVTQ